VKAEEKGKEVHGGTWGWIGMFLGPANGFGIDG